MLFMNADLADAANTTVSCPLRCAVYTRVSVEDGQDAQMPSIEVQTQACRAFIEAHCHENWQAIEAMYADNGYSGGNLQRPALRSLLDDMQSDKIELARAFGLKAAEWKQIWLWPESRAPEIVAWLEAKRDNTQEGRIRKAVQRPGYMHTRGHLFRMGTEALSRLGLDGNSDEVCRQRQLLTGHESRSTMPDAAFANWVAHLEAEVRRAHGESAD